MRAIGFTTKEGELNYITNMRAAGNYPEIPWKSWISIVESSMSTTRFLKEDLDPETVEQVKRLKKLGSSPQIGKKYIPVEIIILNRSVHIMVNGEFPSDSPAKFLTLDELNNGHMKLGGREVPNNYLSKVAYADVILIDSVEKYDHLRTMVELQFEITLPPVEQNLDEAGDKMLWLINGTKYESH